jgi:hypothetical protein
MEISDSGICRKYSRACAAKSRWVFLDFNGSGRQDDCFCFIAYENGAPAMSHIEAYYVQVDETAYHPHLPMHYAKRESRIVL